MDPTTQSLTGCDGTQKAVYKSRNVFVKQKLEWYQMWNPQISVPRHSVFIPSITACLFTLGMGCSPNAQSSRETAPAAGAATSPVVEIRLQHPVDPLPALVFQEDDWPWWRGIDRDGISKSGTPPEQWNDSNNDSNNVLWKVPLVDRGNSSPIVVKSHVYLTSCNVARQEQYALSIDRTSGRLIWQTTIHTGGFTSTMNAAATYADATLASDGERVFATFLHNGSIVVTALTLDGEKVWETNVGPFQTVYGFGASPIIFESTVIVAAEDPTCGSISALHRRTGQVLWRIRRAEAAGGTFATPVVAHVAGRWQLLLNGARTVSSYDPATGEPLWSHPSPARTCCNSMAFNKSFVFASGGMPSKETACFNADAEGDDPSARLVWQDGRPSCTCYVPSLLSHDGRLYNLNDDGILTGFDERNGRQLFAKRLVGKFSASPMIINGKLIVINQMGTAWVLRASPPFDVLSENQIEPGVMATPTSCKDTIYLRSEKYLYGIGEKKQTTVP